MLKSLLDSDSFFRRALLNAFYIAPSGRGLNGQTVELFAMSDPTRFGREPKLLLHPPLDFEVCSQGAHGARLSSTHGPGKLA